MFVFKYKTKENAQKAILKINSDDVIMVGDCGWFWAVSPSQRDSLIKQGYEVA